MNILKAVTKPVLFFALILVAHFCRAQTYFEFEDTEFRFSLKFQDGVVAFYDSTSALTLEEVEGHPEWFGSKPPSKVNPEGIHWVKITILNSSGVDLPVVALEPRTINTQLFVPTADSVFTASFGTYAKKQNLNLHDSRSHAVFWLKNGVAQDVYFRTEGASFRVDFQDLLSHSRSRRVAIWQDALLFGASFILIFYSLIQWLVYRKKMFFYLLLFTLGTAMYSVSTRGYFIDWVLPNLPRVGLNFSLVWSQVGQLGSVLLVINFLELKRQHRTWFRVFQGLKFLIVFRTIYGVYLTAVHHDYGAMTTMAIYTLFIDVLVFFVLLFSLWRSSNKSRRAFLVGLSLYGFGLIMVMVIWKLNVIPDYRLGTLYTGSMISLVQMIVFSIALGLQMRQHEVDKNVALDELNMVLKEQNVKIEHEVVERTSEIESQRLVLQERNEKIEVLFKEVHHRVKNNLQLISSLLNLQQEWSSTEDPAKAIEDSRSRVVAMSMIHQFLYRTDDISLINFREYALELASKLNDIQISPAEFNMVTDFEQDYDFDIDTSISLGLILNELITNSYKYAVNSDNLLNLSLSLREVEAGYLEMVYADSGPEIKKTQEELVKEGFGLRMASRLSRQLQGKFVYQFNEQNEFKVLFANQEKRIELADA